jgi:hypothetical protein
VVQSDIHFRDLILESFECPHCFFKNNSIKSAGQIQELGCKYTLEVENAEDLQRQVVRSDVPLNETLDGCELSLFRHLNTKGFDFEHGYITSDDLTL